MSSKNDSIYSSETFQAFFRHSHQSLVIKAEEPQFTILAVSDRYLDVAHQDRHDLLGMGWFQVFPGSAADSSEHLRMYNSFCSVISTGKPDRLPVFKYEIYLPEIGSCETLYWSALNEPVLDTNGKVAYIINTTININDPTTGQHTPKEGIQQIESLQREQLLNMELATTNDQLIHVQEQLYFLNAELEQRIKERTISLSESEARFRNLAESLREKNEQLADSEQNLVTINKRLQESEQTLQMAIQSSGMETWNADLLTGLLNLSEKSLQIHGLDNPDGLTLKQYLDLVDPNYRDQVKDQISNAINNNGTFIIEYILHTKSENSSRWIRLSGVVRSNFEGQPVSILGTVQDITERKQDDERKSDFIGMVSHELKTPLTSLNGYIQILQFSAKKSDDVFTINMLNKANNQIAKMTKMINGFLNVSRLESGKIQINHQHFDLSKLLKETEEEAVTSFNSHQIIFVPVPEIWVNADPDKIGQVINNLISNAAKYSPLGSVIEVACTSSNGEALVSVRDRGMGIAKEDLPKLFERYYRVKGQIGTIAGFGIGLYLCYEIIKRHEGNLWAESEIGQGSTFYFSLPLAPANT